MEKNIYYPIGQQDFKTLRETNCVYIDKTRYIAMLTSPGSQYYFLARPRRFGKHLDRSRRRDMTYPISPITVRYSASVSDSHPKHAQSKTGLSLNFLRKKYGIVLINWTMPYFFLKIIFQ